jgi:hypothetical protein
LVVEAMWFGCRGYVVQLCWGKIENTAKLSPTKAGAWAELDNMYSSELDNMYSLDICFTQLQILPCFNTTVKCQINNSLLVTQYNDTFTMQHQTI